jgi:SAM-dependent methyltransferase
MMEPYYGQVAAAFDRAAASYHADYASNPIQAWMADETYALLDGLFPGEGRLLEIGCGAGEMAVRLAASGRHVVATDISPQMIERAAEAAQDQPGAERITWITCAAGEVGQAVKGQFHGAPFHGAPFDGAYSNFGPLNCEPDLRHVAEELAGLLRENSAFVCSVMNRWCAWEIAWGLLRFRPREATRRLHRGWVQARMSAAPGEEPSFVPVRYYTPGEFARHFRPYFRLERAWALPFLIPPPYLAARFPDAPARLTGIERRVRSWPGIRSLGDHFLLVLRTRLTADRPGRT